MPKEKDLEVLRRIPFFSGLSATDLEQVQQLVLVRKYRRNMIIFVEGEPGEGLFFVKSGRVKVYKLVEDGREKTLHFLNPGDVFAEVLLFDGGPYPATAETIEDAEIGLIKRADIEKLLLQNPSLTLKLLKIMSKRLRQAQLHVRDLALRDAYGCVASMLLKLAKDYGVETGEGVRIDMQLTQQELANLVGVSRETVARILGEFRKSGCIALKRQQITVVDPDKLSSWL